MKVLLIGGSGNISSACTNEAIRAGHQIIHFNRGISHTYSFDKSVTTIIGDINKPADRELIRKYGPFDVVADFICYSPQHMKDDIAFFTGLTDQFIFISSATVYKKPPDHYIITEECPLENRYWQYSQNKILCENLLTSQNELTYTIVRPSYTYGYTWLPVAFTAREYNPVYRIRKGLPLISHGDGESLWVMTHNTDFARAFTGLFGNKKAMNNHFHITSDGVMTWDYIYKTYGKLTGIEPILVHIPSDFINEHNTEWGAALLGDKTRSMVFDNSKIKSVVPGWQAKKSFEEGIRESIAWFESDEKRMKPDMEIEEKTDYIINTYQKTR